MNEIDYCGDECTLNLHTKRLCRSSKELRRQLSELQLSKLPVWLFAFVHERYRGLRALQRVDSVLL